MPGRTLYEFDSPKRGERSDSNEMANPKPPFVELDERLLKATQSDGSEEEMRKEMKLIVLLTRHPFQRPQEFDERRRKAAFEDDSQRTIALTNRLFRVYGEQRTMLVDIPSSPDGELRQQWMKHLLTADVTHFREILRQVVQAPTLFTGERTGLYSSTVVPEKVNQRVPDRFDESTFERFVETYLTALRIAQGMLWYSCPLNLILWEPNGTGKTTLMIGLTQLLKAAGTRVSYSVYGRGFDDQYKQEPFRARVACVDQFESFPWSRSDSKDPPSQWRGSLMTTVNLSPTEFQEHLLQDVDKRQPWEERHERLPDFQ